MEKEVKESQLGSPSFWERQKNRMSINRKLLPLKLVMFLMYGGMAALMPYMTPHMKSIGLTGPEISTILGILPIASFIGPPIGGAIADKLGKYKAVLIIFNLISIACHVTIGFFLPHGAVMVQFNVTRLSMNFDCHNPNQAKLAPNFILPENIQLHREIRWLTETRNFTLTSCVDRPPKCANPHQLNGSSISLADMKPAGRTWHLSKLNILPAVCQTNQGQNCTLSCQIPVSFQAAYQEPHQQAWRYLSVGLYTFVRILSGMMIMTIFPVLDATAYQMAADWDGDLGFQRIFTLFGMCMFPPLSSVLTGIASKVNWPNDDYSPSFYIFIGMHSLAAVIIFFMPVNVRESAESIWRNVGKILRNPKVFVFVLMMLISGGFFGFLENFLFIFMENGLGSQKYLFGFTNLVSGISAVPVIAASTLIMKHFGHTKLIMLCIAIYGIRFFAYAYIYNPYHIFPVEILESFTQSLLWIVASVHCGKIAPDYLATLQGVIGSVHHGIGKGAGSYAGGMMFEQLGYRTTYKIFGIASFVTALVYAILHYTWLRNVANPERRIKGEEDNIEVRRESHLSPEDEHYLRKVARNDAFTRRYSMAVVLSNKVRGSDSSASEEPVTRRGSRKMSRRRSTLVPTLAGHSGRV